MNDAAPKPSNPFAPSNAAPVTQRQSADNSGDLDFSMEAQPLADIMEVGVFRGEIKALKLHNTGKLIVEVKILDGKNAGQVAERWFDPSDRDDLLKLQQAVANLGVDTEEIGGQLKPVGGWLSLVGRLCDVAVDEWNGRLQIPKFGKLKSDLCPPALKGKDFGCGILPPE